MEVINNRDGSITVKCGSEAVEIRCRTSVAIPDSPRPSRGDHRTMIVFPWDRHPPDVPGLLRVDVARSVSSNLFHSVTPATKIVELSVPLGIAVDIQQIFDAAGSTNTLAELWLTSKED